MSDTQIPARVGDGYLEDMNDWSEVLKAREYYETYSAVPPVRKFAKFIGADTKSLFDLWMTGPMKPITKYGGLPKPTGCV